METKKVPRFDTIAQSCTTAPMIGREETASAITGGDAKRRVRGLRRGNCVEGTPAKTGALLTSSPLHPGGALQPPAPTTATAPRTLFKKKYPSGFDIPPRFPVFGEFGNPHPRTEKAVTEGGALAAGGAERATGTLNKVPGCERSCGAARRPR